MADAELEVRVGEASQESRVCHAALFAYEKLLKEPAIGLRTIVQDLHEFVAKDFYRILRKDVALSTSKIASHSITLAEVAAYVGANQLAHHFDGILENDFLQAAVGGFVGSEITTILALPVTYIFLTYLNNWRSKGIGEACKSLKGDAKWSLRTLKVSAPKSIKAFMIADVLTNVVATLVFHVPPEPSATIATFTGSLYYMGSAKVGVDAMRNGYAKGERAIKA